MACEHKRIKSVNCVISCMDCGEILPVDYLKGKTRKDGQTGAESPEKGQETPKKRTSRKKVAE